MTRPDRTTISRALCEAGRRLDALGLVPARDGNLSARLSGETVLVTATGVRKRELMPEHLVEVGLDGRPRRGGRASTELGMHLAVYRLRPDVEAIVHAHPPTAVGFASAGLGLTECLMPEVAVNLGAVPLTPYATPGTPDLEAAIRDAVLEHDAFLLANHGAVTMGTSVDEALDRMETLEHFARISLVTRLLGGPQPMTPEAVGALQQLLAARGVPRTITCEPAPSSAPSAASSPSKTPPAPETDLAGLIAEALRAALQGRDPASR